MDRGEEKPTVQFILLISQSFLFRFCEWYGDRKIIITN